MTRRPISYLLLTLCVTACDRKEALGPDRLEPVGNLQAYSIDSAAIGLEWSASPATNTGYMEDHEISIRTSSQTTRTIRLPVASSGALIDSLTEGTIYNFEVTVRPNASSPYRSSLPATINWSPAKRLVAEAGTGAPLRLYESASQDFKQALQCYSDSARGPRLYSLAAPERAAMDMYLMTVTGGLRLRSGALYSLAPAGRATKFSERLPVNASSLNTPQSSAPGDGTYILDEVNVPTETVPLGMILFARTADNHYVRILILRGANGSLVQGTAPNRYITVYLSYQSVAGVRYACGDITGLQLLCQRS